MNTETSMKRLTLLTFATVACAASMVLAGTIYQLTCPNDGCKYTGEASFFGGRMFALKTGWCTTCGEFTGIRWKRSEKPPEPAFTVWNSRTGQTHGLYPCPKCKKPFLPIERIEDLTHCPKCGKDGLKHKATVMYD